MAFTGREISKLMLGVQRTSVSITAHTLQQAGVLTYSRGHITITNVEALREMACECYEVIKMNYGAVLRASND